MGKKIYGKKSFQSRSNFFSQNNIRFINWTFQNIHWKKNV
jgi:hypothetical protein